MSYPKQLDVPAFYGKHQLDAHGVPTEKWEDAFLTSITPPYQMRLAWDTDQVARKIRCHKQVARDLSNILEKIWDAYDRDLEKIKAARMDLYGGCYNYRPMRGLATLSMHSWGVAIDLDPDRNALGVKWEDGKGMMPTNVIDIFQDSGWTWGGGFKRPDAMHFQAAGI